MLFTGYPLTKFSIRPFSDFDLQRRLQIANTGIRTFQNCVWLSRMHLDDSRDASLAFATCQVMTLTRCSALSRHYLLSTILLKNLVMTRQQFRVSMG